MPTSHDEVGVFFWAAESMIEQGSRMRLVIGHISGRICRVGYFNLAAKCSRTC